MYPKTLNHLYQKTTRLFAFAALIAFTIGCGATPQKPIDTISNQIPGSTGTFSTGIDAYDPSAGVNATIEAAPDTSYFDNTSGTAGESLSSLPGITQTETPIELLQDIGGNLGNIFGGNNSTNSSTVSSNGGLFNQGNNSGGLFSNLFNRGNTGGGLFGGNGLFNGGGLFNGNGLFGGGGLFGRFR